MILKTTLSVIETDLGARLWLKFRLKADIILIYIYNIVLNNLKKKKNKIHNGSLERIRMIFHQYAPQWHFIYEKKFLFFQNRNRTDPYEISCLKNILFIVG